MRHNASEHLVCFVCRKQFRKPSRWDGIPLEKRLYPHEVKEDLMKDYSCPECKSPMINMGRYFKPPRRADKRSWEQMHLLARYGVRFASEFNASIYCSVVGSRLGPAEAEEVKSAWRKPSSAGQHLLQKMKRQQELQGRHK